jgi:hypothetical protein
VAGLAVIMFATPAFVALLAMIFGGHDSAGAAPVLPLPVVPILELTRVLVTIVLAATLMRTAESEA